MKTKKRGRPAVAHPVRLYPTVRIDPPLYALLRRAARQRRMSAARFVNELIEIGLETK